MSKRWQLGVIGTALVLLSVAAGAAPLARPAAGPDAWPVFRGNERQTGVTASRLPDSLEVLWTFDTGDAVEGGAAIADGVVYVGSDAGNLHAIDLATGKPKWKYITGVGANLPSIRAAPAIHGNNIYVGDVEGIFHCVSADKGQKRWTFAANGEITSGANFAGDAILFASHDETLYCLNLDGKLRWKFKTEGPVYGSLTIADGKTFVAGCDSQLHVLDLGKGTQLKTVDLGGQSGATSAVADEHLYVGTMTNQFLAIDLKKDAVDWTFAHKRAREFYASPAVTDTLVIAGNRDRRIYALDRKTGEEKWSYLTGDRIDASPVVAGERIYAPSMDHKLYVLDLKGRLVQKIPLDDAIMASPAVAGDRLIVATSKGTVYCLGAKQ
jgi:outer membrane protein assembly factor BamB